MTLKLNLLSALYIITQLEHTSSYNINLNKFSFMFSIQNDSKNASFTPIESANRI